MTVSGEVRRMRKEAVMICFKVATTQHSFGVTEEKYENHQSG
jgi:hypothetical protein